VRGEAEALPTLETRLDTGRTQETRSIYLFAWMWKKAEAVAYEHYRLDERRHAFLSGLFFPAGISFVTAYEQRVLCDIRSLDEMLAEAVERAGIKAWAQTPPNAPVIDKRTEYVIIKDGEKAGVLRAGVYLEIIRNIAVP